MERCSGKFNSKTSDIFISNGIIQTPMSLNKVGMEILNPINGTFYDGVSGTKWNKYSGRKLLKRKMVILNSISGVKL